MPQQRTIIALVVCLTIVHVYAYGGGAPEGACDSLTPSHGVTPQNSLAPYKIITSKTTVASGEQIQVTLSGNSAFRGFFLRARQGNSFIQGTFQQNSFGLLRCNGGGMTHNNPSPKNNVDIVWTAPPNLQPGPVTFVATFVQEKITFWTNVVSADVIVTPSTGSGSGQITPGSIPSAQSSTSPTANTGGKNGGNVMENPGAVTLDPECSKSKGCFHDCNNGSPCTYMISWVYEKDTLLFQFLYKMPSSSDKWIALGLSRDTLMGDDSVMECVMDNGNVLVKTSYNNGKVNAYPDDKSAGISDSGGSVKDGVLACSFRRKMEYPVEPRVFNLHQAYYVMVATGEAISGNKFPHSYEKLPRVSAQKISLLQIGSISHGRDPVYPLVKSHGAIMTLAWMFFASCGLFTARHGRSMFHNSKPFGIHVWFHIHRLFMGMTAFLTTAGFILILVESKGYSFIPDTPGKTYRLAHPPLGFILVVLTLFNPLMAIFRPDVKSQARKLFNWAHWGCGIIAWLVSLFMLVIGLDLSKSQADVEAIYVLFAFIGYQLVSDILIRVVPRVMRLCYSCSAEGCCSNKKSYDINSTETPAPSNTGNGVDSNKDITPTGNDNIQRRENVATSIMLILHLMVSACFTIVVLYFFLRNVGSI